MDLSRIDWRKASYSSTNGGNCVEVGTTGRSVAVRDSKHPDGRPLTFTPAGWRAFTYCLKDGARPAA